MIIWSIQNESAWESLQKTRRLVAHSHHQADNWPEAYDWMSEQVKKRIAPAPISNAVPLWGWYQWKNVTTKRPDLRCVRHHWSPAGKYVLLECDIPDDQVLLSDFGAWHIPLNTGFLALDDHDINRFDFFLKKSGWQRSEPIPEPFRSELHKSWELIFDLKSLDNEHWGFISQKSIQASFWEIAIDQVKSHKAFTSRK